MIDRWVTVSDRDAFLTTRRLAQLEGILAGGSGGLALHAALTAAAEIDDPEAMMVVILPDGGRSYLSKIYSDAWMRQYGFLERDTELRVGDVLARKREAGEVPTLVSVRTDYRVRDAVALLHEHRVSQLPVVSAHDPSAVVGAVGERGLLKHAAQDSALLEAEISQVMEPPFPAVSVEDPVREAVELLVGDQQALMVTRDGHPEGLVTRTDLLEALVSMSERRDAFATRAVHAGLSPGSELRLGDPRDPPDLHLRAAPPRRVRRGLRLRALGQPDADGARAGARRARGR